MKKQQQQNKTKTTLCIHVHVLVYWSMTRTQIPSSQFQSGKNERTNINKDTRKPRNLDVE